MSKRQMETYDPSTWEARELVAPDGRTWLPSSLAEEKNLVAAHGYQYADEAAPAQPVETTPAPEAGDVQAAAVPDAGPAPVQEDVAPAPKTAVSSSGKARATAKAAAPTSESESPQ